MIKLFRLFLLLISFQIFAASPVGTIPDLPLDCIDVQYDLSLLATFQGNDACYFNLMRASSFMASAAQKLELKNGYDAKYFMLNALGAVKDSLDRNCDKKKKIKFQAKKIMKIINSVHG